MWMPLTTEHFGRFHDCFSKLDLLLVFNVIMEWLIDTAMSKGRLICLKSWVILYIFSTATFWQISNNPGMCNQNIQVFIWYHSPHSPIPISLYHHLFSCLNCLPATKDLNTAYIIFHKNTFTIYYNCIRSLHFWGMLLALCYGLNIDFILGQQGTMFSTVKI